MYIIYNNSIFCNFNSILIVSLSYPSGSTAILSFMHQNKHTEIFQLTIYIRLQNILPACFKPMKSKIKSIRKKHKQHNSDRFHQISCHLSPLRYCNYKPINHGAYDVDSWSVDREACPYYGATHMSSRCGFFFRFIII